MPQDDEAARKAQAARWRKEIARLTSPPPPDGDPDQEPGQEGEPPDTPARESPRDFTERKSRELDQGKGAPDRPRDKREDSHQTR
jgi:hypothetical protein